MNKSLLQQIVTSLIKLFVMTFLNLGQWHNTKDLSWKEQFYRDI